MQSAEKCTFPSQTRLETNDIADEGDKVMTRAMKEKKGKKVRARYQK